MPKYIACYDLAANHPDPHAEFIHQADMTGWSTWIWEPNLSKWYQLPNTTLIGEFETSDTAKAAFDKAVAATKLTVPDLLLEKYFITDYGLAIFNSDVVHGG
ncbi:hypothetical protein [Rhizobium sp. RAF56]|uniref:hypothetical protein n=1 Tax=Rhizobium sp. RAF56 TaxID=3233062 RepID=UPI003F954416